MTIKAYKVGGCVRDEILGIKSKDIDYAVEAESFDAMVKWVEDSGGKVYLPKPEHFTVRAKVPGLGDADYVLCRKERGYSDGRRPDHVEMGTLYDDLKRRDLTINSIAQNSETGEYIDPFNGIQDIKDKIKLVSPKSPLL